MAQRYRVGTGPIDKAWAAIFYVKFAVVYVDVLMQVSNAMEQAAVNRSRKKPTKPAPLRVESQRTS